MKAKTSLCAALALAAMLTTPAFAMEYSFDSPSPGDFGRSTSNDTIYITQESPNVDRSKAAALTPPSFGLAVFPAAMSGPLTITTAPSRTAAGYTAPAYTAVTADLYYPGKSLATLSIPRLGVSVPVYEGTDSAQLAKGAGHFTGSSIWDGNVCVAGHNRGANCYFGSIHTLTQGDTITLTSKLGSRTYAVTSVAKISETDNSMLAATMDNRITLFTCVRNESAYRWCVQAVAV